MGGMLRPVVYGGPLRRIVSAAVALALATGVVTVPEAWTATYYVATTGSNGNTPAQAQNPATPWKTLTHALAQPLASGDVIQVQPGTYDSIVNGETFPLALVDGVTVKGDPSNPSSTTVTAPAANAVFANQNSLSNLTTLTGLTITHDTAGTTAGLSFSVSSSVTMVPQITSNNFAGFAKDTGILIKDEGSNTTRGFTGLIDHNTFTNFSDGVVVEADSQGTQGTFSPTISNNTFTNPFTAISLDIDSSFGGTMAPLIQGNTVTGAKAEAIIGQMSLTSSGSGASFHPTVQNNTLGAAATASEIALFRLHSFGSGDGTVIYSPTVSGNTVSGATAGIVVEMGASLSSTVSDSAGTLTSNVTISGNTLSGQQIIGLVAALSPLGSSPSIGTFNANWTIANNTVTGAGIVGIGISTGASSNGLNLSGASGTLQLTASGNTVTNAGLAGISAIFPGLQDVNVSRSIHIQGNEVQGSSADGASFGYGLPSVKTDDVQIRDNFLHGNTGVGLEVRLKGSTEAGPVAVPIVRCNTITGNTLDGIRHDSSAIFQVDYGSTATSPGLNTLSGNTSGAKFDFDNQQSATLLAQNNWWGSATGPVPAQINGNVTFSPFLTAPPSVASIPLTVAVVNDVAPPGPSVGDTLRYTATITLSNTCGCAQAVFSAPIPANVTEQTGSATTTQGTVTSENPITVSLGNLMSTAGPITVQWDVVVNSGSTVSSQGTLTCNGAPTLSDDPSTPGPSDPTVTTLVASIAQVPTLSEAGMAMLIGSLLLAGLCLLRRRRRLGGALVLLLLLAGSPWAAQAASTQAASTQATAAQATATQATATKPPRHPAPLVAALATPAGVGQSGGQLSLLLADGRRISAAGVRIEVSDKRHGVRGKARIKSLAAVDPALAAGAGAMVKVFSRPDGSFESIRIVVLDNPKAAQDRVAKYHHKPKP
jgi:hypothetical protein